MLALSIKDDLREAHLFAKPCGHRRVENGPENLVRGDKSRVHC